MLISSSIIYSLRYKHDNKVLYTYNTPVLSQVLAEIKDLLTKIWRDCDNPSPETYARIVDDSLEHVHRDMMATLFSVELFPEIGHCIQFYTENKP